METRRRRRPPRRRQAASSSATPTAARPSPPRAAIALAAAIPDLRLVVDHVLGYNIDGETPPAEWQAAVRKLAKNPNVHCKVSGLYQRCVIQPAKKDADHYRSLLDILWKEFGPQRLIYGSNWPCTKKSGDYRSFVKLVNDYFSDKGKDACENYFWKNAVRVYGLEI